MKTSSWLWLIAFLLIPSVSFAANIKLLSNNIVIDDELTAFRFRENPGLWQRSTLVADQTLDLQRYGDYLYLTTLSGGVYKLYHSREGLSYEQVWSSNSTIGLINSEKLIAINDTDAKVFSEDGSVNNYELPQALTNPQSSITVIKQQVLVAIERSGGLDIFDLTISSTQPKWSLSCADSYFFTSPAVLIGCDDSVKTVVNGELAELVTNSQLISTSPKVLLWSLPTLNQYLIYDGEDLVTLEFTDLQPEDELEVAGDRLFLRQTTALFEVAWRSDPINIVELPELGELRFSNNLTLLQATNIYYSRAFGSWQQTNLDNTSLEYIDSGQGVIGYLPLGSVTYSEQAPGNFSLMPDTWAASSKIKAIEEINGQKLLLILRNSSNNPNLYQSTDYLSWQRITLPGQPTYLLTIDKARQLPPTSLVELVGKVSVLPGWVSDNIGYLTDNTGAIQFYLSSTRGDLTVNNYRHATLLGEISTSQVGRIIMEDLGHLILAANYQPTLPNEKIANAKAHLGSSFIVKGEIVDINTNDAILADSSDSVKLHYNNVKEKYSDESIIEVSVVFDLNSSSGEIEAWYTGQKSQLVAPAPVEQEPAPVININALSPLSLPKNSSTAITQPIVTSSQTSDVSIEESAAKSLVSAERSNSQLPTPIIFLSGLIAGVLVARGRRFGKFSNGI